MGSTAADLYRDAQAALEPLVQAVASRHNLDPQHLLQAALLDKKTAVLAASLFDSPQVAIEATRDANRRLYGDNPESERFLGARIEQAEKRIAGKYTRAITRRLEALVPHGDAATGSSRQPALRLV
ncbi:hypothetical protein GS504_01275 [Rhodococcus hoagii]|nr:hypothetical protein [Prescottella equi]NKS71695.1 hypothetical protein [Prescottella equi]